MERFALTLVVCALAAPTHAGSCPDLSGDGVVDSLDLNILLVAFGSTGAGDLTGDGITDSLDLNTLLAQFGGQCASPPNDLCSNPTPILPGQIVGFTLDGATPDHTTCAGQPQPAVWFTTIGTGEEFTFTINTLGLELAVVGDADPLDPCTSACCIATSGPPNASPASIGGGCCDPQPGPGCDDQACEAAVCAIDARCCEAGWDEACADVASSICGCGVGLETSVTWCATAGLEYKVIVSGNDTVLRGARLDVTAETCTAPDQPGCVYCGSGSQSEIELCGQNANDTPDTGQPIPTAGLFCGSVWSDGATADTDCYVLSTTETIYRTIMLKAEFPFEFSISPLATPDQPIDADASGLTEDCPIRLLDAQLPPGSYVIRLRPLDGVVTGCPTPCSGEGRYLLTMFNPFPL